VLAPTLSPGDIVVADNLACHKHPGVRRDLHAVCATIGKLLTSYTPPECTNYLENSGYDGRYVIPV
jgi:hypothetical protein